jgi:hypothetical protein
VIHAGLHRCFGIRIAASVLGIQVVVLAQAPPSATAPASPASGRLADQPYVDRSFGFSLRPFADCEIIRQKQMGDTGDVELVQFLRASSRWSMGVRQSRTTRTLNQDDMLAGLEERLKEQHKDLKVVQREKLKLANRDAVRIGITCTADGIEWFRQQAVIFCGRTEYYVIVFNTPAADRAIAETLFDQIARSFEIVRSELQQEQLRAALDQGEQVLKSLAKRNRLPGKPGEDRFLRITLKQRDIGYAVMHEYRTVVSGRPGIGIHQETWLFDAGGPVKRELNDMFLADDLAYDRWDTVVEAVAIGTAGKATQKQVAVEHGVHDGNRLLVAFSERPNATQLEDKVIEPPRTYASVAVFVLFGRLVDLSKPELYAFAGYSSERRGLVVRAMRVVGPQDVLVEGKAVRATRIDDSEGLIPPVTELYVDSDGQLVKVAAGSIEMTLTTKAKMAPLYEEKVKEVLRVIEPPPPSAPPGRSADPRGATGEGPPKRSTKP